MKRDRLRDLLSHSEEVMETRRDELEQLRSDLAESEGQVDSLNVETYHLNIGKLLCMR